VFDQNQTRHGCDAIDRFSHLLWGTSVVLVNELPDAVDSALSFWHILEHTPDVDQYLIDRKTPAHFEGCEFTTLASQHRRVGGAKGCRYDQTDQQRQLQYP
jgi:hypothetical protein